MAILKVANVHFDAAGTNRLDYLNNGTLRSTSNIRITNAAVDANFQIGEGTGNNQYGYMSWDRVKNRLIINADAGEGLVLGANNLAAIYIADGRSPASEYTANVTITGDVIRMSGSNIRSVAQRVEFRTVLTSDLDPPDLGIDSSGNVVIGRTTSTVGQGVKLDINGAANTSDILVNGVSVSPIGQQTIWVPAVGMYGRTTNGAASGTVETSTNRVMIRTLDFDTTTQEFAQFAIQMPKGWNESTLICQFVWSHAATTTNFGVVWQIQAVAFANDDALDTAFGTAVTVADTGGTTNDVYISDETAAMTVAGSPGPEEYVVFQVARVPANASDTMAIDARLHGVKIHYTINAAKDD